ncbi:MAG: transcriptional regulator, partial [Acidobacteriaceae bacterium]
MRRNSYSVPVLVLSLVSLSFAIGASTRVQAATHAQTASQVWTNVGPYGGDARSLAFSPANPSHILMGTTNSWIYQTDDGTHWTRLNRVSNTDTLVVDHIVFDAANPQRVLVAAWRLDRPDGGIFLSEDGGTKWKPVADMSGQSVRALAQAPSNPKIFVAGTLKGVYRSEDSGQHWTLISPNGSTELHEIESVAIDPVNPQIIYAGTWHLPWKTEDGGKTWKNIKQGLIVDSDVFSIIIDPHTPSVVYTSACSGIYKSSDAGMNFHKIQGIPSAARRTRVLKQDPSNASVVYAGTTEGLYRTADAGTKWMLMTPKDIIINDIYVDPKNSQHVIMATDRSGVLESNDGATSFHPVNQGFSERAVSAVVTDPQHTSTVYVGVLNDKRFGGVFVSRDAGQTWNQINQGLNDNDIFSLAMSTSGNLLAGTNHGIYRLKGDTFENVSNRLKERTRKVTHIRKKHRVVTTEITFLPNGKIED